MGLFWDLIQQSQISEQKQKSTDLDSRVRRLEGELQRTQQVVHDLVTLLEQKFGQDIDRDGRIG